MFELNPLPGTRARGSRRRGLTRLVWAIAGAGALSASFVASARADTVFLRDGRIVRGEVRERPDGRIEILHKHGSLVVERTEIARVDSDSSGVPKTNPYVDTVFTHDGRVLMGNVTVDEATKEIVVTNEKFGGETRIGRDLVRTIIFRKGKVVPSGVNVGSEPPPTDEDSEAKWRAQIDIVLKKLRDPAADQKQRAAARTDLLGLGIYATQYVRDLIAAVGSSDTAVVLPALQDVLRVAELKSVVAASIEERYPNVCEALIDPDEKVRVKMVEQVAVFDGEKAPPLLLHLIRHDASAKVKAICVGELSMLKRYEDLGSVLKMQENGQLRFVAALELGEAGILAGIPVIIEALRLDGPGFVQIRTTAIDALKKYTGQGDLGYLPESSDKEAREEAVKRWETWWAGDGKLLVEKNLKGFTEISEADRAKAIDRWRSGNKVIDDVEAKDKAAAATNEKLDPKQRSYSFELAAHLFKEATDIDPSLCSAHLSRALVLYQELGRSSEAESILKLILARYAPEDAKYPRLLATYHLGRIAEMEGEFHRGELRYQDAAHIDETFYQAYVGAGDCALEQGLAITPGQAAPAAPVTPTVPAPAASPQGTDIPNTPLIAPQAGSDKTPPTPAPSDGALVGTEKQSREENVLRAIASYRQALDAINKKAEGLKNSARDLGDATGETADFPTGRLMQLVKTDRADLTKTAATVWFRLGRAETARGDGKEALLAFKAARTLDPTEPSYEKACTFWEDALHTKEIAKEGGQ